MARAKHVHTSFLPLRIFANEGPSRTNPSANIRMACSRMGALERRTTARFATRMERFVASVEEGGARGRMPTSKRLPPRGMRRSSDSPCVVGRDRGGLPPVEKKLSRDPSTLGRVSRGSWSFDARRRGGAHVEGAMACDGGRTEVGGEAVTTLGRSREPKRRRGTVPRTPLTNTPG